MKTFTIIIAALALISLTIFGFIHYFTHVPIKHREDCFKPINLQASEYFPSEHFMRPNEFLAYPSISSLERFEGFSRYIEKGYKGVIQGKTYGIDPVLIEANDTLLINGEITLTKRSKLQMIFNDSQNMVGYYITIVYKGEKYLAVDLESPATIRSLIKNSKCYGW